MKLASMLMVAMCGAGCASSAAPPPKSSAKAAPPTRSVELRHYYLLTPGANATLIVSDRDVVLEPQTKPDPMPMAMESRSASPR